MVVSSFVGESFPYPVPLAVIEVPVS